jgi:hypothetical protein
LTLPALACKPPLPPYPASSGAMERSWPKSLSKSRAA